MEMLTAVALFAAAYLIGAIPFGYLVARLKGVDLFKAGSGNIGATNVGRVLGRKYAVLVFALDFLKGAVPVAVVDPVARALGAEARDVLGHPDAYRVGAAALAFLGHLFPVYLGFRGGKGVATGAGAVTVLVPGPAALAVVAWAVVALATRYVSLASLVAAAALVVARVAGTADPFGADHWLVTAFCFVGAGMVVVKHRGNVRRLLAGTENRTGDGLMRQTGLRALHLLALGFWFGGAGFFNFVAAPAIFDSFKEVVNGGPSDRTAGEAIVPSDAPQARKEALASALAGSAVGPIFPRYFLMQLICGSVAWATAMTWWTQTGSRFDLRRVEVIAIAFLLVVIGLSVSEHVSQLRLARFDPNPTVAEAARAKFGPWHLASLLLSLMTTCLAGVGLMMASKLPPVVLAPEGPSSVARGGSPGRECEQDPAPEGRS
jgi:acyl-phosphate glycerol 3-phosphate acyltransferase